MAYRPHVDLNMAYRPPIDYAAQRAKRLLNIIENISQVDRDELELILGEIETNTDAQRVCKSFLMQLKLVTADAIAAARTEEENKRKQAAIARAQHHQQQIARAHTMIKFAQAINPKKKYREYSDSDQRLLDACVKEGYIRRGLIRLYPTEHAINGYYYDGSVRMQLHADGTTSEVHSLL